MEPAGCFPQIGTFLPCPREVTCSPLQPPRKELQLRRSVWKGGQGTSPVNGKQTKEACHKPGYPPSTKELFHAASCETLCWASAKTQCKHDTVKSLFEANTPSIWSHCDPHAQQGLPTVHTPRGSRIVSPSQPPNSQR